MTEWAAKEAMGGQPTPAVESGNAGGGEGAGTGHQAPELETEKGLGVEVPPELKEKEKELLRAFHSKTQALAERERTIGAEVEEYKRDAMALYDLAKQDWFKKAVETEKGRRTGKGSQAAEITEETFEALKSDKRAFQDFLAQRDKDIVDGLESRFRGEFEKLGKSQQQRI